MSLPAVIIGFIFYGEFYYGRIWDLDFFGSHALVSMGDEKKIY